MNESMNESMNENTMSGPEFLRSLRLARGNECYESIGDDSERLELARRGRYYGEQKPHPRPDLETLSTVHQLSEQLVTLQRLVGFLILRVPRLNETEKGGNP